MNEDAAVSSLAEMFGIDDGSLEGLSPQECFLFGVEWQKFRTRLSTAKPFTDLVLASNADRLTKLAERSKRFVEARPASNGWVSITVGDHLV